MRPTRESSGSDQSAPAVRPPTFSLLDLAPSGVYQANPVTRIAGALLPLRFTLTCALRPSAVCFLLHFPCPRGRWTLSTTVILRSPDFPPHGGCPSRAATFQPAPVTSTVTSQSGQCLVGRRMSNKEQETRNKKQETRNKKQETRNKKCRRAVC